MIEWKTLLASKNRMEAEIVKSYLESRDIKVLIQGEAAGPLYGLNAGPLAEVEILVPVEQFDLALSSLEEFEEDAT